MYICWDRSMAIGHPIVDAEHKVLFDHINDFVDSVFGDEGLGSQVKSRMSRLLDGLRANLAEMFRTEEILMRQRGFPNLAEHRREHRELLDQFDQFVGHFNATAGASLAHAVRFLREWLDFHLENWDRPLGAWLRMANKVVQGVRRLILPDADRRNRRRLPALDEMRIRRISG